MKLKLAVFVIGLFLNIFSGFEVGATDLATAVPRPDAGKGNWVSDRDHVFEPEQLWMLNRLIARHYQSYGQEVVVVVMERLEAELKAELEAKAMAQQLFQLWQVGKESQGKGLLMLFLRQEKKIEFAVGEGFKEKFPEELQKRIAQDHIAPFLAKDSGSDSDKDKDQFHDAVLTGMTVSMVKLAQEGPYVGPVPKTNANLFFIVGIALAVCLIFVGVVFYFRKRK